MELQKDEIVGYYNNKEYWTLGEVSDFLDTVADYASKDYDWSEKVSGFDDAGYENITQLCDIPKYELNGIEYDLRDFTDNEERYF